MKQCTLLLKARELSSKDVKDLTDLFSGKRKCRVKQVYTNDPIIDSIPMALEFEQAWSERDDYVEKGVKNELSASRISTL